MNEEVYIRFWYGTCKLWPCSCQQRESRGQQLYEDRFLCENWQPCQDKSWVERLERLRNEKDN